MTQQPPITREADQSKPNPTQPVGPVPLPAELLKQVGGGVQLPYRGW